MKLTIDNLSGLGPVDYTACVDATVAARVERTLNQPSGLRVSLIANQDEFVVPVIGARIGLTKTDGTFVFTGYLTQAPQFECLGWGEHGAVYRYQLIAESDEVLLDQKVLSNQKSFIARSAGSALRQLAQDLLPGGFDTTAVQDVDVLAAYTVSPEKKFSFHAGEIALAARGSYRAMNGALVLAPVGAVSYTLSEGDGNFSPMGLKLVQPNSVVNDVTVIGLDEPQAYVRDYFVGNGMSQRFYLSQMPFQQIRAALIDEEYAGSGLDPATWTASDPASAISVAAQTLQISGGSGQDGQTMVSFTEQIELGGALELQHGDVSFSGASRGVIGGLYAGGIAVARCLAGFQVTPNGSASNIQALINGAATGPVVPTTAGHRYVLTTYLYSMEVYRSGEIYHSWAHPAGSARGGAAVAADVRLVLELQDIDPANLATLVAPATVLYDNIIANAAGFCTYALVNAINMQCSIAYTYGTHISLPEVRTALPNSGYVTQLVGSLSNGGQCMIASSTTLDFYPQYVPPLNTLIVASYRGSGRAVAEVVNSQSVGSLQRGGDDGVRGLVRAMKIPGARTQADCENAALAILDDAAAQAWSGSYQTWSDFLPSGANDIFPGDAVAVNVPSQNAVFSAIVRKVAVDVSDPGNDRGTYTIEFANDPAVAFGYRDQASAVVVPLQDAPPRISTTQAGAYYAANLTDAQLTQVTSTTVQVDVGMTPPNGGVEVRAHDYGWGAANDRNLLGRFGTQTFTLPRLSRTQNYFLRLYDNSSPPKYSRYAAALHVDYPL
ncbi:MAG TPA: hypothetical protein VE377_13210 [Candidatus Dormibacteraeota bacterium]|nr:hypothetical protein [Candidatus Dormibacteraeota bacterium]